MAVQVINGASIVRWPESIPFQLIRTAHSIRAKGSINTIVLFDGKDQDQDQDRRLGGFFFGCVCGSTQTAQLVQAPPPCCNLAKAGACAFGKSPTEMHQPKQAG